jgi:dipeptidyl aminopeptidase/acylaminoacyl peptidase
MGGATPAAEVIVLRQTSPFSSGLFSGGSLELASPAGGCRELLKLPDGALPLVSPDGQWLAYRLGAGRPTGTLVVSRLDGSAQHVLARHATTLEGWGSAHRLVYRELVGGKQRLTIVRIGRGGGIVARAFLAARDIVDPVALSPDGRWLAFLTTGGDGRAGTLFVTLQLMRVDGSGRRALYRGTDPYSSRPEAVWSPDGTKLLVADDGSLLLVDPRGAAAQQPANLASGLWPTWSPDGSKIAFSRSGGGAVPDVYVMSADGGHARRLTVTRRVPPPTWAHGSWPGAWSPDGRFVAVHRLNDAAIVAVDGSGLRTLCPAPATGETVLTPLAWRS